VHTREKVRDHLGGCAVVSGQSDRTAAGGRKQEEGDEDGKEEQQRDRA
jgi:hypothetical protein